MDYQSKERPILFSGPMVRAILGGRKTQTRRPVLKKRTIPGEPGHYPPGFGLDQFVRVADCPYGIPGDRLWVRESIRRKPEVTGRWSGATYLADFTPVMGKGPVGSYCGRALVNWKWKRDVLPSIHMPRWASRITLEVTDVRVERVQDISHADVLAEGLSEWQGYPVSDMAAGYHQPFAELWDSINAKRGYGWDLNPWVWVVEFQVG